jgi:UDP-N-acetyl-D-galactosamine dehydrogenase
LEKEYKISIIGLGYVGLPLALAFSAHYKVVGYDVNAKRVSELNKGVDSNLDVSVNDNSNLIFSSEESCLK